MEGRGGKEDACQSEKRHNRVWRHGNIDPKSLDDISHRSLIFFKKEKFSAFWKVRFGAFFFSSSLVQSADGLRLRRWSVDRRGAGEGLFPSSLSLSFSPANRAATVPLDTQRRRMKGETLKGRIYGGPLFDPRPKGEDGGKEMLLQFSFFFGRGRGL